MSEVFKLIKFLIIVMIILCTVDYLELWGLDYFNFINPDTAIFSGIFSGIFGE